MMTLDLCNVQTHIGSQNMAINVLHVVNIQAQERESNVTYKIHQLNTEKKECTIHSCSSRDWQSSVPTSTIGMQTLSLFQPTGECLEDDV
jgi:hypothetical protein